MKKIINSKDENSIINRLNLCNNITLARKYIDFLYMKLI